MTNALTKILRAVPFLEISTLLCKYFHILSYSPTNSLNCLTFYASPFGHILLDDSTGKKGCTSRLGTSLYIQYIFISDVFLFRPKFCQVRNDLIKYRIQYIEQKFQVLNSLISKQPCTVVFIMGQSTLTQSTQLLCKDITKITLNGKNKLHYCMFRNVWQIQRFRENSCH